MSNEKPNHDDDSPLKVPLVRRMTVATDQWGLHSVPTMLSDFRRHASHGNLLIAGQTQHIGSVPPVNSEEPESMLGFIPAMISLPTGLLAAEYLSNQIGSISSVLLISGTVTALAGLASMLESRTTIKSNETSTATFVAGLLALCTACICVGSVLTTAFVMACLNVRERSSRDFVNHGLFLLALAIYQCFSLSINGHLGNDLTSTVIGIIALALAAYGLTLPTTEVSSSLSLALGALLLIIGIIVGEPAFDSLSILIIISGSLGVFLLAKRDVAPTRLNSVIGAVLATCLESLIKTTSPWGIAASALSCAIPVRKLPRNEVYNHDKSVRSGWSIVDAILAHDDTRNIFYFLLLNFSFMLIQLLYSILSHSLGLLSDSIHMFFDCIALLVGLVSSILSKFPPSSRFPYGLGKVETVSGFTNGCLLIAISGGVIAEAMERISHPVELDKISELLVVSTLGLLVNLVGIFAFNHGHGHSHTHEANGHGHDHSHSHSHSHSHGNDTNQNLHGIFLHIIADTMGSIGVIVSTIFIHYFGWFGFDPIASIFIAVLIFVSAMPLVASSAKTMLLSLSDSQEYQLRDILNEISVTSGVAGYSVPKFWADGENVRGVIHVQYLEGANSTSVRNKVEDKLREHGIDNIFIQVEAENAPCWCKMAGR